MKINSIKDYSRYAASKYLQSAVFIDDRIYTPHFSTDSVLSESAVPGRKKAFRKSPDKVEPSSPESTGDQQETDKSEEPIFRAKDFVNSFANHGIVCALYEPEPGFSTEVGSVVQKLCESADLIILDWDFHEDGITGTKPKQLILNLVQGSNQVTPHHVRLIVVYTTTPLLSSVANAIFQELEAKEIKVDRAQECEHTSLVLQIGASRILVLGKPTVGRPEQESPFTVLERDLADKVVEEFSKLTEGILPSCALLGVAAVRRNSRRILDKFKPSMDAAFLLHRALIKDSEEAFDQLSDLLADEFRAIVEDELVSPAHDSELISNLIQDVPLGRLESKWKKNSDDIDPRNVFRAFINGKQGLDAFSGCKQANSLINNKFSSVLDELIKLTLSDSTSSPNEQLAVLYSVRTQYANLRTLTFGTVIQEVAESGNGDYLLCLMPICDSIRLNDCDRINFPFWRLLNFKEKKGDNIKSNKGNGFVADLGQNQYVELVACGKPREKLLMLNFSSDPKFGAVVAEKRDKQYLFSSGEKSYLWIAQLKSSHMQRISHEIGQSLSRVGLNEAEWVRLTCT